jgi:hypothetical protein
MLTVADRTPLAWELVQKTGTTRRVSCTRFATANGKDLAGSH